MRRAIPLLAATALAGAAMAAETITYSYDALGRLITVSHSGSVNAGIVSSYAIDKADNRTNRTVSGASSQPVLAIADASGTEGQTLSFTVTRSGPSDGAVSVAWATAAGSAASPGDFQQGSGTLSFAAGETSKTISVTTVDDLQAESEESFSVTLSSPSGGAVIGDGSATGTISDNDSGGGPVSFAVGDASASEGGTLTFTVTRSGDTSSSHSLNYATADSSALAGSDYSSAGGSLTFLSGETTKSVTVQTVNDSIPESTEQMLLNISGASGGATISDDQGIGTITDDDSATPPSYSVGDTTAVEGDTLIFAVTRSGDTSVAGSVSYASADGSATAPGFYTAVSGTLTFLAGETSKTVSVPTIYKTILQGDLSMYLNLSSPSGSGTLGDAQAVGTIIDDVSGGGGGGGGGCPIEC